MAARLVLANGRLIDVTGRATARRLERRARRGVIDAAPERDVRILYDESRIIMILQDGRVVKDSLTELAHGV